MTRPSETELPLLVDAPPEEPSGKAGRFRKRYLLVLLIPVFMFAGAVIGLYFQPPGLQKFYALTGLQPGGGSNAPIALPPNIELPQDMVETMLPTDVVGLARVMPRGDVAVVAAPFGASDARVSEILVAVGDRVERGVPLAYLDNRASLESAVFLAEANLAIRQAALVQTRSAVQASRDEAQATLDQAQSTYLEAQATLERSEELVERGVSTSVSLDAARTAAEAAALAVTRAEATLARFSSAEIDAQPDVVVAARNVEAAEAELARTNLDLSRALIVAPITGTILDIHATPGQRPPSEGVMEMGDISQMTAEVEVYQDRIAAVRPGQPVELVANAIGRTLHGTVQSIGLTVGRQGLISDDVAANTDARVIRVVVALDDPSSEIASRFTNLEVIARIDTGAGGRATR
ncbi:HlyD family efflux transporter periplasmic adaptor subunit [Rhodovulum euryhalinum]|uniref:HlyD family secretion protein n=1 Tax=Rhodovulum euryhalinum TaxID=35805 RepID=A0A4R2KR66_9RHOB|nr:HlyD family efflux transporter periplasmic adaptor subunit [Rhodovulum euryhalinum]TCO69105.1 HlyD family secretion protein [Rhodovulum euryhalinum]